jgi:hypothetical protein
MSRHEAPTLLGLALLSAGLICVALNDTPATSSPNTLEEVAEIAHTLGLHCRSDRQDGALQTRLVISGEPLTLLQANFLRFGDPRHPCWTGTVAVSICPERYLCPRDVDYVAEWGAFLVFGDPELVRKLTAPRSAGSGG